MAEVPLTVEVPFDLNVSGHGKPLAVMRAVPRGVVVWQAPPPSRPVNEPVSMLPAMVVFLLLVSSPLMTLLEHSRLPTAVLKTRLELSPTSGEPAGSSTPPAWSVTVAAAAIAGSTAKAATASSARSGVMIFLDMGYRSPCWDAGWPRGGFE